MLVQEFVKSSKELLMTSYISLRAYLFSYKLHVSSIYKLVSMLEKALRSGEHIGYTVVKPQNNGQ